MSYVRHEWQDGEVITAPKLNNIEEGIAGANTNTESTSLAVANSVLQGHNASGTAHADIRALIAQLAAEVQALSNADDTTIQQLEELMQFVDDNQDLIDSITTSKVNVADVVNNLTTDSVTKPLSAKQGMVLKGMITAITLATLGGVPLTRTINGKALNADVTLNASDVGARANTWTPTASEVGARSDTWKPTPAEIAAEPAVVTEGTRSGSITLTLQNNHVYPCTGVTALNITVPANVAAHLFVATSSAVTITFNAGSGVTLKAPDGEIEPLEANANYEISIWNGNIIIVQVGAVA